jgi:hypothetical protein
VQVKLFALHPDFYGELVPVELDFWRGRRREWRRFGGRFIPASLKRRLVFGRAGSGFDFLERARLVGTLGELREVKVATGDY